MNPGRSSRIAVVSAAFLVAAVAIPPAAASNPASTVNRAARAGTVGSAVGQLAGAKPLPAPEGWQVSVGDDGVRIVWRSLDPVPLGDAAVEFQLGDDVLGVPRPLADGRTFVLHLPDVLPGPARDLTVTSGGLPLNKHGRVDLPDQGVDSTTPAPATSQEPTRLSPTDPGVPGPYSTTRSSYELAGLAVPGFPEPVEVVGEVVSPVGASGARPLVLFLHGRHSTCYRGGPNGRASGDWPCPAGWQPIPSHLGYLDAQELLASQGYVTVSIAANGVNGQDWAAVDGGAAARSLLVRHHLQLWHQWANSGGPPFGTAFQGAVDLDHVLLVGHSRGGEGVNRAAIDSTTGDPWHIDGQVLIGPTAFGRQTAPGVATTVLLPYCDGDVSDLQGQQYVDQVRDLLPAAQPDPALRSAVLVMGANHNYFNQEWTPGESAAPSWDDWWDPTDAACGDAHRLTPAEQRTAGAVYVATSAAAFVEQQSAALPLLNGTPTRPASLGATTTHVTALGAQRSAVYYPDAELPAPAAVRATASVCKAYGRAPTLPRCLGRGSSGMSPHFLPMYEMPRAPAPQALHVGWGRPGGRVTLPLGTTVDLTGATSIQLRVAVLGGGGPARFGLEVVDSTGGRHQLGSQMVWQLPGSEGSLKVWGRTAAFRLPPSVPRDIRALRLLPQSQHGDIVVLDVQGRRPGFSSAPAPVLPRVDIVDRELLEGDGGPRTELLTLQVSGPVGGGEQVWVQPPDPERLARKGRLVRLSPGQSTIQLSFTVDGNTRDDYDLASEVYVKAVQNVVTGRWAGQVAITDDDPAPRLLTGRVWSDAVEAQRLQWRVRLSEPSGKWVDVLYDPAAPADGPELALADVSQRYRKRHGLPTGDRQTPLSRSRLRLYAWFEPGMTAARVWLPIQADDVVEGIERVDLAPHVTEADGGRTLRGRVSDA